MGRPIAASAGIAQLKEAQYLLPWHSYYYCKPYQLIETAEPRARRGDKRRRLHKTAMTSWKTIVCDNDLDDACAPPATRAAYPPAR